jgi:hypothetical protein
MLGQNLWERKIELLHQHLRYITYLSFCLSVKKVLELKKFKGERAVCVENVLQRKRVWDERGKVRSFAMSKGVLCFTKSKTCFAVVYAYSTLLFDMSGVTGPAAALSQSISQTHNLLLY